MVPQNLPDQVPNQIEGWGERGLQGPPDREIVSFRSCVRAVCLVEMSPKSHARPFPFSLLVVGGFPLSLLAVEGFPFSLEITSEPTLRSPLSSFSWPYGYRNLPSLEAI